MVGIASMGGAAMSCAEAGDGMASAGSTPGKSGAGGKGVDTQNVEVPKGGSGGTDDGGGDVNGDGGTELGSGGVGGQGGASGTGGGVPAECVSGTKDTKKCGACDSGTSSRTCSSVGTWGSWEACIGEDEGYPRNPGTDVPKCPPYNRPAVYFTPHPISESIGMAGSIATHLNSGAHVFIEVMSHGESSGVRMILKNGQSCGWHDGIHNHELTEEEFGKARVREFKGSASKLGVHGVYVGNCKDREIKQADVAKRIEWWKKVHPGDDLRLKGVAGSNDPSSVDPVVYHSDYVAVWQALLASGHGDIRGYLVMHYITGSGQFSGQEDISAVQSKKQSALKEYKVWNPSAGRYAIGYHSSPSLWESAYGSSVEYVVRP